MSMNATQPTIAINLWLTVKIAQEGIHVRAKQDIRGMEELVQVRHKRSPL